MNTSLKQQILNHSFNCGISSDEVALAKSLVENKCKDKSIFVCEGLWAVEKLIEKNIKVSHFFYNIEKLENDKITEENMQFLKKPAKRLAIAMAMMNFSSLQNFQFSHLQTSKI